MIGEWSFSLQFFFLKSPYNYSGCPFHWNVIKSLITDRLLFKGMEHSLHKVWIRLLKNDTAVLYCQLFLLFSNNYTAMNPRITKEVMLEGISSDPILWIKSCLDLDIFIKADSTTSQGDLFQCLIALMVMNFSPMFRWNLSQSKSCSLPVVLSQLTSWREHLHLLRNKLSSIGNQ